MQEEIKNCIHDPLALERLYREQPIKFKKVFNGILNELPQSEIISAWNVRLNYVSPEISWGSKMEIFVILILALIAGSVAKIPNWFHVDEESFYSKNISFIGFAFISAYFAWKDKLNVKKLFIYLGVLIVSIVYINLLPKVNSSNSIILSCIHMVLFQWTMLGFIFVGNEFSSTEKRIEYLRFNGDLVVMSSVINLAGGILLAVSFNLFYILGINVQKFYGEYVFIYGAAASPLISTYVVRANPQLVNKVSPVIARIFSPLVLITFVAYLVAIIYTGKDPYNDRDFLMLFNGSLLGVLAIILFSVVETARNESNTLNRWIIFLLSVLAILVNAVALSAILYRLINLGITPNRVAVAGGNLLILINLIMIAYKTFRSFNQEDQFEGVEKSIAKFLPVYAIWFFIVTFLFPLLFHMK